MLTLIALSLFSSPALLNRIQDPNHIELDRLPVAGRESVQLFSEDFAMAGIVFHKGVRAEFNPAGGFVTFSLPPDASKFIAEAGIHDSVANQLAGRTGYFEVFLDGDLSAGGPKDGVIRTGKPRHIEVDVTGKRSFQLKLHAPAWLGDPYISTGAADSSGGQSDTSNKGPRPQLVSPADQTQVAGDAVKFRWQPVEGAVAYVISIAAFKFADAVPSSATRAWTATVSDTSYTLKLDGIPNGQYLWSVVAYGPKAAIGKYSKEWLVKLDR